MYEEKRGQSLCSAVFCLSLSIPPSNALSPSLLYFPCRAGPSYSKLDPPEDYFRIRLVYVQISRPRQTKTPDSVECVRPCAVVREYLLWTLTAGLACSHAGARCWIRAGNTLTGARPKRRWIISSCSSSGTSCAKPSLFQWKLSFW